ncbi:MAG: 16S rRNA (cytosine(1402)-N(4))-methyltransferase [Candidatus Portnoybacteria bacterium RBG_13_41_18]|uniref:Ribosomal RNA small subunit methyltransferase H n=1 Tax=Candidatus Portnoybacteria bacterium RBG_13_41_18 TaxID=1801991 RepID=A0A1G2F9X5_9BACT|nr:MAG: 16S rRNA (cytosine(1402)-N(4))-methyltransferase [Candidatus Portnoybacteria bacterium RBG_13_41_18]
MIHIPVLLKEILQYLDPKPGENFIDATLGDGGHALAILELNAPDGRVLGIDASQQAIDFVGKKKQNRNFENRAILVHDNFSNLRNIVAQYKFNPVQGILADLGFSSRQLEASGRGFSFLRDEPLLMTFDEQQKFNAQEAINLWPQAELERIFKEYGEEQFSQSIAKKIIEARKIKPILTTFELVDIVKEATPSRYHHKHIHPATKIFQALRIAVNEELKNLENFLPQALEILDKGGRLAVISFHSLEDRIVKFFFRECRRRNLLKIINKKVVRPSYEEVKINPRSRSAKLRLAIKL